MGLAVGREVGRGVGDDDGDVEGLGVVGDWVGRLVLQYIQRVQIICKILAYVVWHLDTTHHQKDINLRCNG